MGELFHNVDAVIAIGLVVALITSMFFGSNELSMSIASGLIGYIGRGRANDMKSR